MKDPRTRGLKPGDTYSRTVRRRDDVTGLMVVKTITCVFQPKGTRIERVPAITELAARGLRYGQIGAELGLSMHAIKQIIAEYGIPYQYADKPGRPRKNLDDRV
jgi:hypothetical protein